MDDRNERITLLREAINEVNDKKTKLNRTQLNFYLNELYNIKLKPIGTSNAKRRETLLNAMHDELKPLYRKNIKGDLQQRKAKELGKAVVQQLNEKFRVYLRQVVIHATYDRHKVYDERKQIETSKAVKALTGGNQEMVSEGHGITYTYHITGTKEQLAEKTDKLQTLVIHYPYIGVISSVVINDLRDMNVIEKKRRLYKNALCLLTTVDIGNGHVAVSNGIMKGGCAYEAMFDAITSRGPIRTGAGKCPELDMATMIKYIHENRKDTYYRRFTKEERARMTPHEMEDYYLNHSQIHPDTPIEAGATILEMDYIMRKLNAAYFIVFDSFTMKPIHEYRHLSFGTTNPKNLRPGLLCVVNSEHITRIENTILKPGQHLDQLFPEKIKQTDFDNAPHEFISKPLIYHAANPENKTIYYYKYPIDSLAKQILAQGILIQPVRADENKNITAFSYFNGLHKYAPDYVEANIWVNAMNEKHPKLKLKYTGQSIQVLAYEVLKFLCPPSYLSPAIYNEMTGYDNKEFSKYGSDGSFRFAFNCAFEEDLNRDNLIGIDCRSCYSFCQSNMPVPIFSFSDDPEPYNGEPIQDCAFYKVNETGWPLHGSGCYYAGFMVKLLLERKDITKKDISTAIIPSRKEKPGFLKELIKDVFTLANKFAPNAMNGLLIALSKINDCNYSFTESVMEAIEMWQKNPENTEIKTFEVEGRKLYQVMYSKGAVPRYANYLPLALMTYQYSNYIIFKEALKISPDLSAIKGLATDCLVVDKTKVDLSKYKHKKDVPNTSFGTFCIEDKIPLISKPYTPWTPKPLATYEWIDYDATHEQTAVFDMIIKGRSCNINLEAGFGKSYFIKELIKYARAHDVQMLITASTGTAAQKLDPEAMTTHSALGMRYDTQEDTAITDKFNNYIKLFIIDEAYMLDSPVLNQLMKKKMRFPNCAFVFCGSNLQLTVEDKPLPDNSSYLHKLCDGFRVYMTINRRFINCPRMGELCQGFIDYIKGGALPNIDDFELGDKHCDMAICASNTTARQINVYWSNYYCKKPIRRLTLPFPVFVGLPVVQFKKTRSNNQILNNGQFYIIEEITDTSLILAMTDENRIPTGEKIEMTDGQCKRLLMAYCLTAHRSQGGNYKREHTIYELNETIEWGFKSRSWKNAAYVMVSRSNNIDLLNIAYPHSLITSNKTPTAYLYRITHKLSQREYIGSTRKKPEERFREHAEDKERTPLHCAMTEYGPDAFELNIAETFYGEISQDLLLNYEDELIDRYNPYYNARCNFRDD
jgi:hypothetical protein